MSFLLVFLPNKKTRILLPETPDVFTGHRKIYFLKNFMPALTSTHRLYSISSAQYLGISLGVKVARSPTLKELGPVQ